MTALHPGMSRVPDRNPATRFIFYAFIVLLVANFGAMVDLVLYPEIPYFDTEHLLIGGITGLTVILLLCGSETYFARRMKFESTLLESEEHYQALFNRASDGIFIMSPEGKLVEVNESFARMHGYTEGEMMRMNIRDLDTPKSADQIPDRMRRLLAGESLTFEVDHYHKDGHEFPLEVSASMISVRGESYIQCFHRDITERKRAEEELREGEFRYRSLFDFGTDGIVIINPDTLHLIDFNKQAHEQLGYTREEFGRLRISDIDLLENQEEVKAHMRKVITAGIDEFETLHFTKQGERRNVHVKARHIIVEEQPVYFCVWRDITERRRTEKEKLELERQVQQAQKLESLGVLAGGIAHDFNNLLMVVLGHAELALKEISPMSPVRKSLAEITTATQRAADLSRQMLAYAGGASFVVERVDLRELVEEMAHLLNTSISKKAILTLNLEDGLPPIEGDPIQVRQIVMNLIINASEAIGDRDGMITVSMGTTRRDMEDVGGEESNDELAPGMYVHLVIADTGDGMDAETQARIFDPFFTTKFTGRGLGLSAVQGIVRSHKGAIKVYSDPGKGTIFKVLFPTLDGARERVRHSNPPLLADWRGRGTVLLVDDEESLLGLGSRILEHLGFTVLTAADGLQAVDLYRAKGKEIDLVLMDMTMPHMDGAEAFGVLRRLNPEVRVVIASGYSQGDVVSRFVGKGLSGVLQKPYTFAKLRETLAGLLPGRST